ncbi:SRPBCC family protein [Brevibacterium sp.]|uniref:SRPBCC family protein n=1 Tax=Brevibacterium sp. TaxID=1701 RepID=UPI0028124326|nr:SRPBCC family protein [Brevibacterium sp.]
MTEPTPTDPDNIDPYDVDPASVDPESIDESVFDTIDDSLKVVSAELTINAPAAEVFELIADPARHADWDGNDNVAASAPGQRVTGPGVSFITTLTKEVERENHVVEFVEGELIAWKPSEVGGEPFGQKWKWEIEALGETSSTVRHTYDWTQLRDVRRLPRARSTTPEKLLASMHRLKDLAET